MSDHEQQLVVAVRSGWWQAINFVTALDGVSKASRAAIFKAADAEERRCLLDDEHTALLSIEPEARTPEQKARLDEVQQLLLEIPRAWESEADREAKAIIRAAAKALKK